MYIHLYLRGVEMKEPSAGGQRDAQRIVGVSDALLGDARVMDADRVQRADVAQSLPASRLKAGAAGSSQVRRKLRAGAGMER